MTDKRHVALFIVTIPTHLRVMLDAADALRATGRYEPKVVFHPSAVFDQNHLNCRDRTNDSYIWNGDRFLDGPAHLSYIEAQHQESVTEQLPTGLLQRIIRFCKPLKRRVPWLWSLARTVVLRLVELVRSILMTVALIGILTKIVARRLEGMTLPETARSHGRIARQYLKLFSYQWNTIDTARSTPRSGAHMRIRQLLNNGILNGLAQQKQFHEGFLALIRSTGAELVVMPEENLFYNHHLAVHAAHAAGAATCVVPFTIVNTLEWAEAFYDIPSYQVHGWIRRSLARAFPEWVITHKGRRLILPPLYILGAEYLAMAPTNPWLINSGHGDAIAAESPFMCDYYRKAGIPSKKIRLTGAISDDKLYRILSQRDTLRASLAASQGIELRGRIILLGLPPDQFGAGQRPGCEFDEYTDMVRFMVQAITDGTQGRCTLLINLHPRIAPASVRFLSDMGAHIVSAPIEDLVPLADLYVAVASATIRLAITSAVPVVNYDVYRYDYDDYKGLAGVMELKTRNEYAETLQGLIESDALYESLRTAQQRTSSEVVLLDGRAAQRQAQLFDELIATRARNVAPRAVSMTS
ncbi:hypothetical protein [Achromobacter dolens]|uniref:hypothetical protein n=1 Tax=Achromobacter dolens TaxID=1287738 RepID=UPI0031D05405